MATLTIVFIVRIYDIPVAVVLSLVTCSIMLGMKLDKLTMLKHWCAQGVIAGLRHRGSHGDFDTSLKWDKLSTWRRKLDEYEMADAVPYRGRAMNRAASAIQADVQRVALLRTGLLNISLPASAESKVGGTGVAPGPAGLFRISVIWHSDYGPPGLSRLPQVSSGYCQCPLIY